MKLNLKALGWITPKDGKTAWLNVKDGIRLSDLLREEFDEETLSRLLVSETDLSSAVIVLINGKDARLRSQGDTPLSDGDVVTIIPVVHGG